MADNLSPLVNLDLVNQIYRTINAQISERVYDPNYYSAATLGDANHRYVNAYLKALNVSGDVTITGNITGVKNISATTFNNLTLKANTTGFEVSGGTTFKKLTVVDTTIIDKPLTISANTTISANLTVSAATKIIKELTVGADNTGTVTIKSAGAGNTTVVGPSGATAQFNVATTIGGSSANTGSVTIQSSGNSPTTIQGPSGKTAAFKVATTIGDDSNYTGAVEIKSAGTNRTTIIGPSNGSVTFTTPTSTVQGAVEIKNTGDASKTSIIGISASKYLKTYANTKIGDSSNTGDVSIQPNGANALTINGPSDGKAVTLKSGTCVVETDCDTDNTSNKLVKRDANRNILVGKVNNVELASTATGFTATGGTTPKTLTVSSKATLGSTENDRTGEVEVMSGGTEKTTIIGPNNGTATLQNGKCLVTTDAATEADNSKIVQRSNGNINVKTVNNAGISGDKNKVTLSSGTTEAVVKSSIVLGDTTSNGSVTVKSGGTKGTVIIGPNDGSVKFAPPTSTVQGSVEIGSNNSAVNPAILNISSGKSLSTYSNFTVGDSSNTGNVSIVPKGSYSLTISSPSSSTSSISAVLKAGTCVVESECDTEATGNTVVKRDTDGGVTAKTFNGDLNGVASKVATVTRSTNTNHYISFVDSDNKTALGETVYTDTNLTYNPSTNTLSAGTFIGELSGNATSASTIATNDWPEPVENDDGTKTAFIGYVTVVDEAGTGKNVYVSKDSNSGKGVSIECKETTTAEGETVGTYHLYAGAVHNAVWNDLADCIEVPEDTDLEFGYCYSWNGDRVEKTSRKSKNCIGIHSNTAGLFMGEKPVKTIQAAVAGFVLAYTDKVYSEGTPLTWSDNGKLTRCSLLKRLTHPERVIATFYKEEKQESWHGVRVNKRHWVKVR